MKKRIALLALALTLCGSFAAFPVSAHAAEIEIQNQTLTSETALTEETAVKSEMYTFPLNEYHLNKWLPLYQYVNGRQSTMEFTTDSVVAEINRNRIRIDRNILNYEMYDEIPNNEVIVYCKIGAYRDIPERRVTLRFICERDYSAGTDMYSWGDTDKAEDNGFRPYFGEKHKDSGDRFDPDQMLNTSEKINKSSLIEMSDKTTCTAVSGVTVGSAIISSNITVPSGSMYGGKISADPILSGRYNVDSNEIMTVSLPFPNSVSRTINIDLGNKNVTSVLGSNLCENISSGTENRIYAYNINNSIDLLAKGS
jgi:hypothetical protein